MSSEVQQQIAYHSERAAQELSRAYAAHVDVARDAHLELSGLHLNTADWLRSGGDENRFRQTA